MNNWVKTVFNGTIISSQFLNTLQDFIRARAPKMVPFDEAQSQLPFGSGTFTRDIENVMFGRNNVGTEFQLMVGDIVVGAVSGNMASVTNIDGRTITLKGIPRYQDNSQY